MVLPPGAITNSSGGGHPSSGGNGGSPNPGTGHHHPQLIMGTTITYGLGMVSLNLASCLIQDVSPQRGLAGAGGSVPRRNSRNVNKPVITTASNGLVGKCLILANNN